MPVEKKFVNLPISKGIDESTPDELADATQFLTTCDNLVQFRAGAWEKRYGFTKQGSTLVRTDGTTRSTTRRVFAYDQATLVTDGVTIDQYSENGDVYAARGKVPGCHVHRLPFASADKVADVAYANGFVAAATGKWVYILDDTTHDTLVSEEINTSYDVVRLASVGNTFVAIWSNTMAWLYKTFNTAAISSGWSAQGTLYTATTTNIDVASASDRFYTFDGDLIYHFDESVTEQANTNTAFAYTEPSIDWDGTNYVWVAALNGGLLYARPYYSNLTAVAAWSGGYGGGVYGNAYTGICVAGSAKAVVYISERSSYTAASTTITPLTESGGTVSAGTAETMYKLIATTQPFTVDGRQYIGFMDLADVTTNADYQRVHIVGDFTHADISNRNTFRYAATIGARTAGTYQEWGYPSGSAEIAFNVAKKNDYTVYLPHLALKNQVAKSAELAQLRFYDQQWMQPADYLDSKCFNSGVPSFYDGEALQEIGFSTFPLVDSVANVGTGNVKGPVQYVAIYEDVDATGAVHWSATSPPFSSSPTAANLQVNVITLKFTNRDRGSKNTQVALYRTTSSATTYYRVGTTANDPFSANVSVYDNTLDSALTSNKLLYTQPGAIGSALDRQSPPSLRFMWAHGDRLVGIGDDGETLWYSSFAVQGEGPWFSDAFQIPVTGGRGPVVAGCSLDGRMLLFKEESILTISGDGPPENGGSGAEFSPPQTVSNVLGCKDPGSLVVTDQGVFFRSHRGIELLNRGLSVSWVGERIQDTLATYPIVLSANYDPVNNWVIFQCVTDLDPDGQPSASATGKNLVYDLGADSWSTMSITDTAGTSTAAFTHSATVMSSGVPVLAQSTLDGHVMVWDTTTHLDDATNWVTANLETGWLKAQGPQGRLVVYQGMALMRNETNHQAIANVAYNYGSFSENFSWGAANTDGMSLEQLGIRPSRHQVNAIKFRLTDAEPSNTVAYPVTTGKGATILGFGVDFGEWGTEPKLPADQKR